MHSPEHRGDPRSESEQMSELLRGQLEQGIIESFLALSGSGSMIEMATIVHDLQGELDKAEGDEARREIKGQYAERIRQKVEELERAKAA